MRTMTWREVRDSLTLLSEKELDMTAQAGTASGIHGIRGVNHITDATDMEDLNGNTLIAETV